jgi:hypothetical protein
VYVTLLPFPFAFVPCQLKCIGKKMSVMMVTRGVVILFLAMAAADPYLDVAARGPEDAVSATPHHQKGTLIGARCVRRSLICRFESLA